MASRDSRWPFLNTSEWCSIDSWPAKHEEDRSCSSQSTVTRLGPGIRLPGTKRLPECCHHSRLRSPLQRGLERCESPPTSSPGEDCFSNRIAHSQAAGPRRWNRQQGLYIYRSDRLIQSGGWNRLRAEDEHTKLARIAIDIPPRCDELFQINVSKMRVALPADLRAGLKAIVAGVAADAQGAYRRTVATPQGAPSDIVSVADVLHFLNAVGTVRPGTSPFHDHL